MVTINLLPWRKQLAEYQYQIIKKFSYVSVACVLVALMPAHLWVKKIHTEKEEHLAALRATMRGLQEVDEKQPRIIEKEEGEAWRLMSEMAAIFYSLTRTQEDNVCFQSISRRKEAITFYGQSRSVSDLSLFLTHWQAADYFSNLKIEKIERIGEMKIKFRIRGLLQG